jgi:glycerol-3-phosphate cytidylyltransferase-like family protein
LEYFNKAKAMADELFVVASNDPQRALKGNATFQDEEERMIIVSNIKAVDQAILSVDENRTFCATLEKTAMEFGDSYELAFANSVDQNNDTIPECRICEKMGITLIDGLRDKIQSSSWLLKKL